MATNNKFKGTTPPVPDFPERVVLEMTPLCNLNCSMCPRHYIDAGGGYMSESLWKRLVDEIALAASNTIILPFWRGESLLHPEFISMLDYALDKNLRIHMCTNGQLVEEDIAEVLTEVEFVTFSVHTPLGFARAKDFLELRKGRNPTTQVSFVEGEPSEDMIKELVTDSKLGGFDSVRLYQEHTKNGVFGKSVDKVKTPRIYCKKLVDTLVISYDGKVSRCNHIWEPERLMSPDELTIKAAWDSKRMRQIRSDYPDSFCGPCDQWTGHTCGASWRLVKGRVEHTGFGPTEVLLEGP